MCSLDCEGRSYWVGNHPVLGLVIFDPEDQVGMNSNRVRLFIVAQRRVGHFHKSIVQIRTNENMKNVGRTSTTSIDRAGRLSRAKRVGEYVTGTCLKLICTVVDKAIAAVAERSFQQLAVGVSPEEARGLFRSASGNVSDFEDEWVVLNYLTWYQPRHINLVYSFLAHMEARLPDRLQIVDLGCGAWAVQFALAIFAVASGQLSATVEVIGFDRSEPMTRAGKQLWEELNSQIDHAMTSCDPRARPIWKPPLQNLRGVMACTKTKQFRGFDSLLARVRRHKTHTDWTLAQRWLTSIHAAYWLPNEFRKCARQLSPHGVLVTGDGNPSVGQELENALQPLTTGETDSHFSPFRVEPRLVGRLSSTTTWKYALLDRPRAVMWDPPWNPIREDDVRMRGTFR